MRSFTVIIGVNNCTSLRPWNYTKPFNNRFRIIKSIYTNTNVTKNEPPKTRDITDARDCCRIWCFKPCAI